MTRLDLLADGAPPASLADAPSHEGLTVHWEGQDVPMGELSLTAQLAEDLCAIRAEHAAWAWDMARLRLGGQELQAHLKAGESLSMWWCSLLYERHPKMTPQLYTIYKLRALEKLLDAHGVTELHIHGGDARLRRCLAALCAATGRSFCPHGPATQPPRQRLVRRLYAACPALLRAGLRFVHWWWTVRRKLPFCNEFSPATTTSTGDSNNKPRPTATIATYFPNLDMEALKAGRFRSRYWEGLHDALNSQAASEAASGLNGHFVRWLFIRFPAPQLSLADCLAARERFRAEGRDGCSFHYLEEFLRPRDILAALARLLRLALVSMRWQGQAMAACQFAGSRLHFGEYIRQDWAESFRGWRGLERCLQYRAFCNYVQLAGPQRWTLFPLENCPWERMLTHAVHEAGHGPMLGAQHSTIRPTDFRYFDDPRSFSTPDCAAFQPDSIAGNGSSACVQWLAAGMPQSRLCQVEALRYLYLHGAATSSPASSHPPARGATASRHLLVLTSFFADETTAHLHLLEQAMRAGLLDGWRVTLKPHPYLPVDGWLRDLPEATLARVQLRLADGSIADCLRQDVIVWAANSTTAALEAALKGLPLMVMAPVGDFDLCPIQDVPGLARTASLEDVRRALQGLRPLALPEDYLCLDPALPRWRHWLGLE